MSVIVNERTKSAIDDWMSVKDGRESRWHELFGTPERTARTLSVTANCFKHETACRNCMYESYCDTQCDYDTLLEWLRGDA